jgi:hypothetical protein
MLTIKSEKQGVKKHVLWAETFDISRKNDANETYILPPLNAAHTTIVSTSQCTGTHPHAQIVSSSGHCEAYKSASTCDQQRRKKINHWRQALMLSTLGAWGGAPPAGRDGSFPTKSPPNERPRSREFPCRPRLVSDPKDLCMVQKAVGRHTDSPADGHSASLGTFLPLPKIIKEGIALASTCQPGNSVTW